MPSGRPWVPVLCTILLACGGRVALSSTDGGTDAHPGTGGSSGGTSSTSSGIGGSSSSSSSSGVGGSSSTSGSGGSSGGFGSSSSSGTTVDDAGLPSGVCPDDVPFMPMAYAPVIPQKGACTAADISAFAAACGDQATSTSCDSWLTANLAGVDGGGGTTCGNCIIPAQAPTVQGAGYVTCDSRQQNCDFAPNYEGCVQLVDPTHGPACAAAWDSVSQCEGWQCDDCASSSDYTACQTSVDQGICQSYEPPFKKACLTDLADGGAATTTCEPGGGTTQNPDWTFIINLMCGAGG